MTLRVFRKTLVTDLIVANVDSVMADAPIPQGSSQNNVWGTVHMVGPNPHATDDGSIWGSAAYLIPLGDPDNAIDVDVIWDRFTPKDQEISAGFNIDSNGPLSGNFFDIGEINAELLLQMSAMPLDANWWSQRRMLTFANSPRGFVPGTPDTYVPADVLKVRSGRKMNAEQHSESLFAVAIANVSDDDTARSSPINEREWLHLRYAEITLEQAFVHLIGNVEAGAETPWDIAALDLQEFIEPEHLKHSTPDIIHADFACFAEMTFDISVPGVREFNVLSGGL